MANTLLDLAAQISSAAKVVNDFLVSSGHPQPSFDVNGPPTFPSAPAKVANARRQLLDASQAIFDLMFSPAEHLRWLACRVHSPCSYHLVDLG